VDGAFKRFVVQMAEDFNCPDPNWFMACFAFETMETFDPTIRPRRKDGTLVSSAIGLIQWVKRVAEAQGLTTEKLANMTIYEQLEQAWIYFRNRLAERKATSIPTLEDCYMLIHWPAAYGKPLDAQMYVKGTDAFAANAGLDTNKDGVITKREAGALVRAKLEKGLRSEFFG